MLLAQTAHSKDQGQNQNDHAPWEDTLDECGEPRSAAKYPTALTGPKTAETACEQLPMAGGGRFRRGVLSGACSLWQRDAQTIGVRIEEAALDHDLARVGAFGIVDLIPALPVQNRRA